MSSAFSLARISVGAVILALASLSDIRTRRVGNNYWIIMGIVGIGLLCFEILMDIMDSQTNDWNVNHLIGIIPIAILFFDVFWDREPLYEAGKFSIEGITAMIIALAGVVGLIWLEGVNTLTLQLLVMPFMIIVGYVFFYTGLLHGGADAKAFMCIAILIPSYPIVNGLSDWNLVLPLIQYPENMVGAMSLMFPFAFLTLMNAALISAVVFPLLMMFRNLASKDFQFPAMLLGYRMKIENVPNKFVWPMETVRDGEVVLLLFPRRDADVRKQLKELKEMGLEDVWVTPKIPFIVPIFLGFLFSFIAGNVMNLVYNLI